MVELANQLHRTVERMQTAIAVIAHVHLATADCTVAIDNLEFPLREIGIRGPLVRHPADLPARATLIHPVAASKRIPKKIRAF